MTEQQNEQAEQTGAEPQPEQDASTETPREPITTRVRVRASRTVSAVAAPARRAVTRVRARGSKTVSAVAANGRRARSVVSEANAGRGLPLKVQTWRLRHVVAAVRADRAQNEEQRQAHAEAANKPIAAAADFENEHNALRVYLATEKNADEQAISTEVRKLNAALNQEWKAFAEPAAAALRDAEAELYDAIQIETEEVDAYTSAQDKVQATERRIAGLPRKAPAKWYLRILPACARAKRVAQFEQAVASRSELEANLDDAKAGLEAATPGMQTATAHTAEVRRTVEKMTQENRARALELRASLAQRRRAEQERIRTRRAELAKTHDMVLGTHARTRTSTIEKAIS